MKEKWKHAVLSDKQEKLRKSLLEGDHLGMMLEEVQPRTLIRVMDDCIKPSKSGDNSNDKTAENVLMTDYTLSLDYRFLVPQNNQGPENNNGSEPVNEMQALMDVCRSRRHRRAILHPLVQTLLHAKWNKVWWVWLLTLVVYLMFLIVLTVFVYGLMDLRMLERAQYSNTAEAIVQVEGGLQMAVWWLKPVLVVACLFMLGSEIIQIKSSKRVYFTMIKNYLEWVLPILVLVLCFAPLNVNTTQHVAAWTMVVAWSEFVLDLGREPHCALYITMLRMVSWNFLKLFSLYVALFIAFTVSFNITLQSSEDEQLRVFDSFWTTLPKIIVMSTGEIDYTNLTQEFPSSPGLMASSMLFLLTFIFLIYLVLMTTTNALAVNFTKKVVEDARLYYLISLLDLVFMVETWFLYIPCLRPSIEWIQVLSGNGNVPFLYVRINDSKNQRLLLGKEHSLIDKLDDETTDCLRDYWLQRTEQRDKSPSVQGQRDKSTPQELGVVAREQEKLSGAVQKQSDERTQLSLIVEEQAKLSTAIQELKEQQRDLLLTLKNSLGIA